VEEGWTRPWEESGFPLGGGSTHAPHSIRLARVSGDLVLVAAATLPLRVSAREPGVSTLAIADGVRG